MQQTDARRLLAIQSGVVALVVAVYLGIGGLPAAQAALAGGAIALIHAWMHCRTVRRALVVARDLPGTETRVLLVGALVRFCVVLALFAGGMSAAGLAATPMLVGFGVAQLGFIVAGSVRYRTAR